MRTASGKIIATPPAFLNRIEAGKYLGHSEEWLRLNAKRHGLYRPSCGGGVQGRACHYYRDHLEIIACHMLNPDTFDEDAALAMWNRVRRDMPARYIADVSNRKRVNAS